MCDKLLRSCVLGIFLVGWIGTSAQAQRRFTIVDPSTFSDDEDLRFDLNDSPVVPTGRGDLNFAPNIVFSPDSQKAFVSFPRSDKVMVFDPNTGNILDLIQTGENPAGLVLTPDGQAVVAVCLRIEENLPKQGSVTGDLVGSLSFVDVDSLEVRTLDFENVFFSVVNNVVFSADGSTGYIASSGTDQLIRFDVASAVEISRLEFPSGSRPATMGSWVDPEDGDNSEPFLTVVLVGSSSLDLGANPDSIQIVDPDSFTILRGVVPTLDAEDDGLLPDLQAPQNLVISRDGKIGMIADRAATSLSSLPTVTRDRLFFLDLESGETLGSISAGNDFPGQAVTVPFFATPGTNGVFIHFTRFEITVLGPLPNREEFDLDVLPVARILAPLSGFRFTSRPAFSSDGQFLFIGAPDSDALLVVNWETQEIKRIIAVGGLVNLGTDESPIIVPSAPMDIGVTPNGDVITSLNFNATSVELFKPTFDFVAPQLIAQSVGSIDVGTAAPLIIPAAERFFSGVAVSNFGVEDAEVNFSAEGEFADAAPEVDTVFLITANPDPIPVCDVGLGQTTISWDVTGISEEVSVEVRVGAMDGVVLASGGATGSAETGQWVTNGMVFYLIDRESGDLLDTVSVEFTQLGCTPPVIEANPNPIQVCELGGLGQTRVSWDTTGVAEDVEIRAGSLEAEAFVLGGARGSAQTGQWVTEGMVFYLLDPSNEMVLDTVTARFTTEECLFSITETLQPDEQIRFNSTFLQPDTSKDFDGWLALDSDQSSLSGVFFTFDGDLNRLDGGPISSATLQRAVFPEVRFSDSFTTQIEVVNPNRSVGRVVFDLIDSSGELLTTTARTVSAQSRLTLPLLTDPEDPNSTGLFDDETEVDPLLLIVSESNPIQVCDGGLGQTTIRWNATGLAESVEIRVGSVDGTVLSSGEFVGSAETGQWVTDGMVFYLIDQSNGEVLDTVTVTLTDLGCFPPQIVAMPNPAPACRDAGVGQTTIFWDTTGISDAVEIRVGAVDGEILASSGEATGIVPTGETVTEGLTFFLLDETSGEVLGSVAVTLTSEGCLLADFEDGYVRASGSGFVAFERFGDSQRIAILGAQPVGQEETHFSIPHFVTFGGSDTTLKLIHPLDDSTEEVNPAGQGADSMMVSVALRANDGSMIGEPVTVELTNGASHRSRVVDLFGLLDTGVLQSGWIDIETDSPGLVGAAELRLFGSKAMSAVPLQIAHSRTLVFPHVVQGLGFSTGVVVLNPGDEPAQVSIELRGSEPSPLGTFGPVTLDPGNRLARTIAALFPGSPELLGGSIKILSDKPLTALEFFYTRDGRVLSTVPSQGTH